MENQNEKAFTVHIVNNKTKEFETIHTNAIVAGIEEKEGASELVKFDGCTNDICAACLMALNAVEYVFKKSTQVREIVTKAREQLEKKEKEGATEGE